MPRPCFLVLDREFSGNISTRKLVLETSKFNVITAYSGREAIETVERFPAIDAAVLDAGVRDLQIEDVAQRIKQLKPKIPIIVICAPGGFTCPDADYHLEYFDPEELLKLLQQLFPHATQAIRARNEELTRE